MQAIVSSCPDLQTTAAMDALKTGIGTLAEAPAYRLPKCQNMGHALSPCGRSRWPKLAARLQVQIHACAVDPVVSEENLEDMLF